MILGRLSARALVLNALPALVLAQTKVLISNDDGWATANIRALYAGLRDEGLNVVLSAPAENQSGTGSLDLPPWQVGFSGCEFNSCPPGSPPTGQNASDSRLNYVNSFPATATRLGITEFGPQFFGGGEPDIVLAGPNVGSNTGLIRDELSGTVGAATEAVLSFGIPALAISAAFPTQTSFTVLDDPTNPATISANLYRDLTAKLLAALLAPHPSLGLPPDSPILPANILLNVNYPDPTTSALAGKCQSADAFEFVLTRAVDALPLLTPLDVVTCNNGGRLPTETSVIGRTDGCFATVTVIDARIKLDASADDQKQVLQRLDGFLSCV
ncbi:sure-like protein [Fomitiporia mediterranea MF3/22]|uniref:sure-like protein n=1 Tax=Fomitiporia mediterranea (strain MF3/22) TaxID=694068 RepID=UPI0004409A78|nr:sure-like protein [Fomitiporia mediterranea MF3/22]EJD00402.1 sure-like protein [Fomitiporia mediterranea MF3/22]